MSEIQVWITERWNTQGVFSVLGTWVDHCFEWQVGAYMKEATREYVFSTAEEAIADAERRRDSAILMHKEAIASLEELDFSSALESSPAWHVLARKEGWRPPGTIL